MDGILGFIVSTVSCFLIAGVVLFAVAFVFCAVTGIPS
jgi:hypothetical protein